MHHYLSTQCAFNIIPTNIEAKTDKPMEETSENNTGIHFHSKHKYIEILLEMHIYSITIWIMVLHSLVKTNTLHYCNKSYKIPTGVYMTP